MSSNFNGYLSRFDSNTKGRSMGLCATLFTTTTKVNIYIFLLPLLCNPQLAFGSDLHKHLCFSVFHSFCFNPGGTPYKDTFSVRWFQNSYKILKVETRVIHTRDSPPPQVSLSLLKFFRDAHLVFGIRSVTPPPIKKAKKKKIFLKDNKSFILHTRYTWLDRDHINGQVTLSIGGIVSRSPRWTDRISWYRQRLV